MKKVSLKMPTWNLCQGLSPKCFRFLYMIKYKIKENPCEQNFHVHFFFDVTRDDSFLFMSRYKDDPWLWDLDWTVGNFRMNKNTKLASAEVQLTSTEDVEDEENMDILTFLEVSEDEENMDILTFLEVSERMSSFLLKLTGCFDSKTDTVNCGIFFR